MKSKEIIMRNVILVIVCLIGLGTLTQENMEAKEVKDKQCEYDRFSNSSYGCK